MHRAYLDNFVRGLGSTIVGQPKFVRRFHYRTSKRLSVSNAWAETARFMRIGAKEIGKENGIVYHCTLEPVSDDKKSDLLTKVIHVWRIAGTTDATCRIYSVGDQPDEVCRFGQRSKRADDGNEFSEGVDCFAGSDI